MKIKEPFALGTNIFYLIPLILAFVVGNTMLGFLILLVFIFSSLFHDFKPKGRIWWNHTEGLKLYQIVLLWVDTIFALALVAFNFFIFWQKGFPSMFWHAIILAVIALYIFFFKTKRKEYDFYHGVWHIFAATITLLVIFA